MKVESEWFKKNISNNPEVYIPINIARYLKLKHDDKVAIKIKSNHSSYIFPARIRFKIKKDGNCYRFQITKNDLISLKDNTIAVTSKGKEFINDLINLKIVGFIDNGS